MGSNQARFRDSHEWARKEDKIIVTGISDHAQSALGDIVFIELPQVGKVMKQGEVFGVIESVKAASDVYMPMSGKIISVNDAVVADPAIVNKEPYGSGWLIKFEPSNTAEWDGLLSADAYSAGPGKE